MGLFDIISDVVETTTNVTKVVLTPVEAITKTAAEITKDVKDTITGK